MQHAIAKYGLQSFNVYIFEVVEYGAAVVQQDLLDLEQKYLNYFPTKQKYNFAFIAGGGGRGPMTDADKLAISERMIGVNLGRAPINKGVSLTPAAKQAMWESSAHRRNAVYIYDDMLNLAGFYSSISKAVKSEKAQKNTFIKYLNSGGRWRGYFITKLPLRIYNPLVVNIISSKRNRQLILSLL